MLIIQLVPKKPVIPESTSETIPYNPEVTDWRGNQIDENARVKQTDAAYVQANREAMAARDAAYQLALQEHQAAMQQAIDQHNAYIERLSEKYFGTVSYSEKTQSELFKRFRNVREAEFQNAAEQMKAARHYGYIEDTAKVVEFASDVFIDIAGDMTGPAGKGIRAAYKTLKGGIKNCAENGWTLRTYIEGANRGAGDAFSDFVTVGGKTKKAIAKQIAKKMGAQFTGEAVGELFSKDGSLTRAVYNTGVKTAINSVKDLYNTKKISNLAKVRIKNLVKEDVIEGGKRYMRSSIGSLTESSVKM